MLIPRTSWQIGLFSVRYGLLLEGFPISWNLLSILAASRRLTKGPGSEGLRILIFRPPASVEIIPLTSPTHLAGSYRKAICSNLAPESEPHFHKEPTLRFKIANSVACVLKQLIKKDCHYYRAPFFPPLSTGRKKDERQEVAYPSSSPLKTDNKILQLKVYL